MEAVAAVAEAKKRALVTYLVDMSRGMQAMDPEYTMVVRDWPQALRAYRVDARGVLALAADGDGAGKGDCMAATKAHLAGHGGTRTPMGFVLDRGGGRLIFHAVCRVSCTGRPERYISECFGLVRNVDPIMWRKGNKVVAETTAADWDGFCAAVDRMCLVYLPEEA